MDYHSIHGHDIADFDISSSHRLPTVSASAALDELTNEAGSNIPTGLTELDRALATNSSLNGPEDECPGGILRGQVTELWGPPGAGKTALGIQLASHVLSGGKSVVWVDCFQTLSGERLAQVLLALSKDRETPSTPAAAAEDDDNSKFIHYDCLTLPHLIALISRPTAKSLPQDTTLVVFSSLTALINSALPKSQDERPGVKRKNGPNQSSKRRQALQSIMKSLQAIASARNCAVVLLSQCATQMRSERQATLIPSVSASVWEYGISTRVVLFKDWDSHRNDYASIFLAGIQKLDGKASQESVEHVSAFKINTRGIEGVALDFDQQDQTPPRLRPSKRKLSHTNFEIPDSEDDEDYGWADEDEASMPAPPPQWQGSEDILLGQEVGQSEEDSEGQDSDREAKDGVEDTSD